VGEFPEGAVTMLFSDIEGSTAMVGRLGDRYGEALSAHRALMRAAFAAWHGREMSTEGDSFFVVFGSASDAVACAVAAQRALAGYDWPDGGAVRVRMGLHSGQPTPHEGNYIGMDVHRAARIAAAAHGGQVVLSEATLSLASPLPNGVSVRDLGFHRLKDIAAAERIYQLAGPGLAGDFPPLKSLGAPRSLPVPATPLVGRDADLARLRAAIAGSGVRLVTLTGPGGVGKTRLSLAAAAALESAFPHGVFFVALAAVTDAGVMWKTLADILNVSVDGPVAEAVTGYLAGRRALLVLDNLEQLHGAGEVVGALLMGASGLVVLATSRGPLHVQGEQEFPVPPLQVPVGADTEAVAGSAAARLFAQQAGMVRPGFAITAGNAADVAAICVRLDGLPLAIELAAARVRLLAPRALLGRLGHRLGLASAEAGRPLRQQTLRNTIGWSYELLAPGVAQVFRQMSVFAGGADLDALVAVAMAGDLAGPDPLELVAELADVSLITVTEGEGGEPRVGMLETIREYALERLEQDDDPDGARGRHAEYYVALAERANDQLDGPMELAALDRLEAEHDNLRAALAWSLEAPAPTAADGAGHGERAVIGLRLVQALVGFWYQHGHAAEGRRWLQRAVDLTSADAGAPLAQAVHGLGVLMDTQGEVDAARRVFERALVIWRELGDREQQAKELNSLGIVHRRLGNTDVARAVLEEAIAINRTIPGSVPLASNLANLGQLETAAGRLDRAAEVLKEALVLDAEHGDRFGVTVDRHALSEVSLRAGRPAEACDLLSGTFDYVASSGNTPVLVYTLELAAAIAACLGEPLRAARLAGAAETIRRELGMQITQPQAAMLEEHLTPACHTVTAQAWDAELAAGRTLTRQEALALLLSTSPAHNMPG
jgi:predicted ATPase/class 3 adenylate cyclase